MQTQHQHVGSIVDSAGRVNELDIRSKGDRGCDVHAVVNFHRILSVLHRLRWEVQKGGHLRVVKNLALRNLAVHTVAIAARVRPRTRSPPASVKSPEPSGRLTGRFRHEAVLGARLQHHIGSSPRLIVDQPPFMSAAGIVFGEQHIARSQYEGLAVAGMEFKRSR
jgi:hypothetical protein